MTCNHLARALMLLALPLLAGCPASTSEDSGDPPQSPSGTLPLLSYTASPPAGWTQHSPSNTMRLAEFTLPPAGEDAPRATVFFFGQGQGGTVEANLARWSTQVTDDTGNPVPPAAEKLTETSFPTTFASFQGTYTRASMGGPPSEPRPNTTMLVAITETPEGSLFFQLIGATETVAAERENFLAFVRSMR